VESGAQVQSAGKKITLKAKEIKKKIRKKEMFIYQKDSFGMTRFSILAMINKRKKKAQEFGVRLSFCLFLFAFCFLLSACSGVPETYYYTLAFGPGQPLNDGHTPLPYALGVEKFQSEMIYDDDRIIYRDSPFEVKYYYYRRWVASPRHLVTEKVLSYLSESGLFEKVTAYPSMVNVKYVLSGRLLAFEEWDEQDKWYGKVTFKASLYEPATQRVVWNGTFAHQQPVSKKIPTAVVEAISLSLKQCLDDLTKALAEELGAERSAR
jgi:ABC-type uncharacterized transport system auxiliary subunit